MASTILNLFIAILVSFPLYGQMTAKKSADRKFRGAISFLMGVSAINNTQLNRWLSDNTGTIVSGRGFLNVGLQGFLAKGHFIYGMAYSHESILVRPNVSPNRGSFGLYSGASLSNLYSPRQLLLMVGLGYSSMSVYFNGNVPATLATKGIPVRTAKLIQPAFWLNPKITWLRNIQIKKFAKLRTGIDAGIGFYFPASYSYGYTKKTSHNHSGAFDGYKVNHVPIPNIGTMSFTISGFIGF
ncbi:MAG: hypothetical protein K2X86_06010 [Cytophagaceae bacterium]|nr:hypothetical protein [Cytophagaceae bacterium]